MLVSLRTGQSASEQSSRGEARGITASNLSLAPIGWLMAQIYVIAAWASLLFALPLYMTRLAYQNYTEMREMFTQTITALAGGGRQAGSVHRASTRGASRRSRATSGG